MFTISPPLRYDRVMLLLAATAIAALSPGEGPPRPPSATVQATASVRILSSVSIHWGAVSADLPRMRGSRVRDRDGASRPIQLIEFE